MRTKEKIKAFFLTSVLVILFCGCGRQETTAARTDSAVFVYDKCENVLLMTADGDALRTLTADKDDKPILTAFDADGRQTAKTVLSEYNVHDIKCICGNENKIYTAISRDRSVLLCSVDIDSGESSTICTLDGLDDIEKIDICGGKLYWLGRCQSEAKPVEPFADKEGNLIYYSDSGKKIGCVDTESGEIAVSEIDFPVSFSLLEENVTVYAFDGDGGYYFTDYAAPSDKKYTNKLGLITNFEFYGKDGEFAFIGSNDFNGTLPVSKADGESGIIRAASGVYPFFASDMCASESGYVWLKTADSAVSADKRIKRYDLNGFAITGNPIRVISSQYFIEQPFSIGSELQLIRLSDEGFALTVLSLDKSYDAAMISSEQGFANDIKEKGSFYPLNDIDGVSDYLDGCFPYIKEAVTDSEGNICMLPIRVEIPLMAYNEKNCSEKGIVLSNELEAFARSVKQASSVSGYYDCTRYWTVQTQLAGYLSCNKSFDTEEFRRLAVLLKEQCTEDIFKGNFELYSALMTAQFVKDDPHYTPIYEKTLFTQLLYHFQQTALINDKNLRAAPMPLPESEKSAAICTFLCVNPYSDRLSETLAYIENTVKEMSSERNSCMLSDKSTYENTVFAQDLYSVYENGEIYFRIPSEIYAEDFEQYCAGEVTLDAFIAEAERKLSAYLNE